jgi:Arrestin (or S-antigen), C-terminal domain/Arrestin (or S-antigen), N-terminal domain
LTFTFSCELPPLIPETVHGTTGSITYFAEAVLDIPWRFDKEIKTPFTVVRYDNLNSYPELLMPRRLEEVKTFCCLCWKNGPCIMKVSIPHGGYAPGGTIPIWIEYDNRSSTDVELTRCKLIRTLSYTSFTPDIKTKKHSDTIIQNIDGGVAKGKSANIETAITIPSFMNNSNSHYCRVVEVSYSLEVEGVVRGCHSNIEIRLPITLGAIGVGQAASMTMTQGYPQQPITMPTAPVVVANDLRKYSLCALVKLKFNIYFSAPTFDEAVGTTKKSEAEAALINPNFLGWNVPSGVMEMPSAPDLPEKQ